MLISIIHKKYFSCKYLYTCSRWLKRWKKRKTRRDFYHPTCVKVMVSNKEPALLVFGVHHPFGIFYAGYIIFVLTHDSNGIYL